MLDKLTAAARVATERRRRLVPEAELVRQAEACPVPPDFRQALLGQGVAVIAEVKKASPSRGVIRPDFDPVAIALDYAESGADAISVLTEEEYFLGSPEYLKRIALATGGQRMPLLRKDFITEDYQVYEARAWGAGAVLLIAGILEASRLKSLLALSRELGLAALVEVHDEAETGRAVEADAGIIGINNRDLKTFQVDIRTTERLRPLVPDDRLVVTESGITGRQDVVYLDGLGIDAVLVGEALMRGLPLRELRLDEPGRGNQ
jgi:indole-3-glycerol phosphate synthase